MTPDSAPSLTPQPAASGPTQKKIKKGEMLFSEGDSSRAMYLLKSGMIRIFKKKGNSSIEIDTIHSGQILGELAFLDGNPRSASGEALTDCDMIEISGPVFQNVLGQMPEWLKMLLKTIVARLRTASTRIRQLESASTAFDYSEKDGKRSAHYVYLPPGDILKLLSALLLIAARNGVQAGTLIEFRIPLLNRYANQIMNIPVAKITSFLDILHQVNLVEFPDNPANNQEKAFLLDIDFLEKCIAYLNEENLLEPSKQHNISLRGFMIMSLIVKYLDKYPVDEKTQCIKVNIAEIKNIESSTTGKEAFRFDEFPELVKLNYATHINIKDGDHAYTLIDKEKFFLFYRLQRVVIGIHVANEQKRKGK